MKKIIVLIILFKVATSCVVTESLTFNQDGSGKLIYKADMSTLMQMMESKISNIDSEKKSKKKKKKLHSEKKDIDSVFTFKELLASKQDSITRLSIQEQERLKKMEQYTVHMVMNESKNTMYYEFFTDFKTPAELQELVSPLNTITELNKTGNSLAQNPTPKNEGITTYKYDGKQFKKFVKLKTKDEIKEEYKKSFDEVGLDENESNELSESLSGSLEMIYKESGYIMVVTFPSKIKSISIKDSVISEDGKTATLTFPMEDFMKSENLNFEVELE